ncbi:hypothetical protein [Myroides sp. WP-1]|uniref:hypothetical protein n=1 Tax=Myroides sp. WP-1 TaxID=2759944 RepID=UPI0015F9086C|nr:hypothetical protein [Myroides sp. WP-1]MBB1139345.1 hypothetical protein [Myroides sp. WP-1]
MSKITIKRSAEFSNKARKIALYLGEEKIGTIKDGETKEFEIQPGQHTLTAKIDWCRSNHLPITIGQDEMLFFNLKGTSPFLAIYYITFGKNKYLKLEPKQ